jgi:uncharacterized Ntn-hydrolase superfamily protein
MQQPSTFSIVARDLREQAWGTALASRFPAVGSIVPWARADVGVPATQALANTSYGPRGGELMAPLYPKPQLTKLLEIHDLCFRRGAVAERVRLEGRVIKDVQKIMKGFGYYTPVESRLGDATREACRAFIANENFEGRALPDAGGIDGPVLASPLKKLK